MSGYPMKSASFPGTRTAAISPPVEAQFIVIWDCSGKGPAGTRPIQLEAHDTLLSALEYQHKGNLLASGCHNGTCLCVESREKANSASEIATGRRRDAASLGLKTSALSLQARGRVWSARSFPTIRGTT